VSAGPGDDLLAGIGGTPLVELSEFAPHPGVRIFAKLESVNPAARSRTGRSHA
jgi:cysteine synthase